MTPIPAAVPVPTVVLAPMVVPVAAVPVPTAGSAPEVDRTPEETLEAENEPQVEEPESLVEEVQDDDLDSLFGDDPEVYATPSAD
jgi:ribosomal protein L12E/L44/L45/RPP1/RPP2